MSVWSVPAPPALVGPPPPLEALVQHVQITDDRQGTAQAVAAEVDLETDAVLGVPYVLMGSPEQIVDQLHAARDRWGITRWVVRATALHDMEKILQSLA